MFTEEINVNSGRNKHFSLCSFILTIEQFFCWLTERYINQMFYAFACGLCLKALNLEMFVCLNVL